MIQLAEELEEIAKSEDLSALDGLRVSLLGKKGRITQELKTLGQLSAEERKERGQELNQLKQTLAEALEQRKAALEAKALEARLASESLDVSLSPAPWRPGYRHPISVVLAELQALFHQMGFSLRQGPLIEDEDHNFSALNIPEHHPARQMQDTFYIKPGDDEADSLPYVLRTHTSPVQIRTMRSETPPIRIIAPGATFRSDSDLTHTPMFHQLEGLYIDQDVHMGHLKGCVSEFLRVFFNKPDLPIRFRPSFFPFTEPSAEIDIGCKRSRDEIVIGEGDDWLEVMGCGMVHPNVLRACNLDPDEVQGFAFGVGIERLAMLKYNIPDLRTFFDSDLAWMKHYAF